MSLGDEGAQSAWETWVRYEQWTLGIEFDGLAKDRPDGVRPGHDPAADLIDSSSRTSEGAE